MALQLRRGTAADVTSESFVPAIGEPLYVTDEQKLYVGDGVTQKGISVGGASTLEDLNSVTLVTESVGSISFYAVSSNVATVTIAVAQGYTTGLQVTISGSPVTALNGTHTITGVPTSTQFTFALTNADVATTATTGTVTPIVPDGHSLIWDNTNSYWKNGEPAVDIVDDTTPQLGGDLDVNNFDIVSTGAVDIELSPATGQNVVFKGNGTDGSGRIVLNCEQNTHGITLKGPPHSAGANYTLTLPNNDGDADQYLTTDGSGVLSWQTPQTEIIYTQFKYNLAAAPTGTVTNSSILGQQSSIGTWSEVTFANNATNGTNIGSASFDPTLTGVTVTTGLFETFTAGVYRIDVNLEMTIDNLATNSYFNYDQTVQARNGSTVINSAGQNFNFTTVGTAPASAITQDVNFSMVVHLENATASSNEIRINLDGNQSQNYYCSSGLVTFTKIA